MFVGVCLIACVHVSMSVCARVCVRADAMITFISGAGRGLGVSIILGYES